MNPTAIYSKSGKGVQEAAGKTSLLKRPDRAVLAAIDGRASLADVAQKVGKTFDPAFQTLITQLDKDGFIREVSSGAAAAAPAAKPAAPAAKAPPPKPAAKPAATAPMDAASDLDFSSLGAPSKPSPASAPPKEQQSALNKAREEAEARAQAERDRLKKEAEAKTRAEMEAKLRAEAEKKLKEEAASKAKADADAKVKAAREAAVRAAAEAKAKVEAEAKTKLDAERKAREETERKLAEERKAREEAERKAKEEAERARKELEEERKRLEEERKREDEERAARRKREDEEEQARRKQKEEEERKAEEERAAKRKEKEEKERLAEEERAAKKKQREEEEATREREEEARREAERAAKKKQREEEEAERERQEEAERAAKKKQREEERHKAEAAAAAAAPSAPKVAAPAPKAEAKKDSFSDSLLADLDSFTSHDEEDAKAKEEAERKAKAARQEAEQREREESERKAKEESERKAKEEAERRKREDEERRREEEEARQAQEDERRKREAEEIRRKAEAATAAAMAKEGKSPPKVEDIPVTEDDLDMDEVKREQAALAKGQPKEEREEKRKPEKKKKKEKAEAEFEAPGRRPPKLGKPIAIGVVALLVIAIGAAHVVPIGTADFERTATEALGRPVKIGGAKLWLLTGVQLRFSDVAIGDAKIAHVTAHASPGSITGDKKEFSSIELDGLTLPQEALADALFARVQGDNFTVERIVVKSLALPGPATLPKSLQADMTLDAKGAMRSATVRGPDGLVAKLVPKDDGFEFDVIAAGFTLPIAPQVVLSNFGMKGTATPRGMQISEWGGAIFGGAISGTANMRWGSSWNVDGVFTVRSINAAVFAPALLSAGSAEGTGKFTMNAADPSNLMSASRVDGNFTVNKGTLGSFDLARAIQTGGKQFSGTTPFAEMNGQGTYDRGAVALRNVTIGAGALNAGASADISQSGALSGRIVADMKTAAQTLRGTLLLGGTVKEPQVRN